MGFGARIHAFQNLQRNRIREILLVASAYDAFILEEDGQINELVLNEYMDLNLRHAPHITRVSSASDALRHARDGKRRFDLIITMTRVGEMHVLDFARAVKEAGVDIPVALLTYDSRELNELIAQHGTSALDALFIWQGDVGILLALTKSIEDRRNAHHDILKGGVQAIVLVEDSVRFYSAYLPMIYTELMGQAQSVLTEGFSFGHKLLRMRARPKILLSQNFEDGWKDVERYRDHLLGVILDVEFPKDGKRHSAAGLEFARRVKELDIDIPVLLQSREEAHRPIAHALGASFLQKDSPHLLQGLRRFMRDNFSFGDFIFRRPDGKIVGRARDVLDFEAILHRVPEESIRYHAERNHFSNWLKARAEFALAERMRPRQVGDFPSVEHLRQDVIRSIRAYRRDVQRYLVADWSPDSFDPEISFAKLGGGSMGGKARGLAFVNTLLSRFDLRDRYPGVHIDVPPSLVIGTDHFDTFLDRNGLREMALGDTPHEEIVRRFLEAKLPRGVAKGLRAYLASMREPLAVRSSSLLEDSQWRPLAGVYDTIMLPNRSPNPEVRFRQLREAVIRVWASTFSPRARSYFEATSYRLEEEKMAVILQRITGRGHGRRFYPDFSGEVRSHNYYPVHPAESSDGMASVALGLGRMVVEDGAGLRFCPRYPRHLVQFASTDDMIRNTQRTFYGLDLAGEAGGSGGAVREYDLAAAREDGTLHALASVWSPENDAVYDGLSRDGVPLVTFAPILKHGMVPLAAILELLLVMGRWGMTSPVEFEFAYRRGDSADVPGTFSILQLRPLVPSTELDASLLEEASSGDVVCRSTVVMGSGAFEGIRDIVYVHPEDFERSLSRQAAREVGEMNALLRAEGTPCLLIGQGRWGSKDPWLGIPVEWDQISSARVIVETCFSDMEVTPSQGTHFFHNLTAFEVGYMTVHPLVGEGHVDWDWLLAQETVHERELVRHVRLEEPLRIVIDSGRSLGIAVRP
jgi:hypothetical protein